MASFTPRMVFLRVPRWKHRSTGNFTTARTVNGPGKRAQPRNPVHDGRLIIPESPRAVGAGALDRGGLGGPPTRPLDSLRSRSMDGPFGSGTLDTGAPHVSSTDQATHQGQADPRGRGRAPAPCIRLRQHVRLRPVPPPR